MVEKILKPPIPIEELEEKMEEKTEQKRKVENEIEHLNEIRERLRKNELNLEGQEHLTEIENRILVLEERKQEIENDINVLKEEIQQETTLEEKFENIMMDREYKQKLVEEIKQLESEIKNLEEELARKKWEMKKLEISEGINYNN